MPEVKPLLSAIPLFGLHLEPLKNALFYRAAQVRKIALLNAATTYI